MSAECGMDCCNAICCSRCRRKGCWEGCCCCFAAYGLSRGKCLSIFPGWPLTAILMVMTSAILLTMGLEKMRNSLQLDVAPTVINVSYWSIAALILINFFFAYSVMSNKMRIHNVHWDAEGCRGYRIKDAKNCCGCLLRIVCKFYNLIILICNWVSFFLGLTLFGILTFTCACCLFIVSLCQLDAAESLDKLIHRVYEMQSEGSTNTAISGFISIDNSTSATDLCAEDGELETGAYLMLAGGTLGVLAQVIMLVSFNVVSAESWRHMKTMAYDKRKTEKSDRDQQELVHNSDANHDMRRQQMMSAQGSGAAFGSVGGAPPFSSCGSGYGSPNGTSMAVGSGRIPDVQFASNYPAGSPYARGESGNGGAMPPPPFGSTGQPPSSFGHSAQTAQEI